MKTGVSTTPWFKVSRPRRAWASVPRTSNFNIRALSPAQWKRAARLLSHRPSGLQLPAGEGSASAALRSAAVANHQLVVVAPLGQFSLHVSTRAASVLGLR